MSDDEFWVDTPGLAKSAEGFHAKGYSIQALADRISALMGSDVAEAVGLDSSGKAIYQKLQSGTSDLHAGVKSWGDAVHSTGDAVKQAARTFDATEANNTQLAQGLASGLTGDGDAPATPVTDPVTTPTESSSPSTPPVTTHGGRAGH